MNISTKSQYALRALIYLAQKNDICSIKDIAVKESISADYLEKILLPLKKSGVLGVKQGVKGGYYLAKRPENIKIGEIVLTLEKSKAPVCLLLNSKGCSHDSSCLAKGIWNKLQADWIKIVNSYSLADALSYSK